MMNNMMGRDGGMMGFRPVGMQGGGMMGQGAAEGGGMTDASRAAIIEQLMSMTGMRAPTFIEMTNEQLMTALQKVEADALKALEMQQMQQMPMPPTTKSPTLGSGVTGSPGYDPAINTYTPPLPESNQPYYPELPMMAGGGIMSLRGY